jgi:hypothetical protein
MLMTSLILILLVECRAQRRVVSMAAKFALLVRSRMWSVEDDSGEGGSVAGDY